MTKKIFRSIFLVAVVVIAASLVIASSFLYGYYNQSQEDRLREELMLAKTGVEGAGSSYFDNFNSSVFRFTLISTDGRVLYDSEVSPDKMDNHHDREEIAEALQDGHGSSVRYSSTLTERTFYEAVKLSGGDVLRISATQVTIGALVIGMLPGICAIVLFSLIVALILSQRMAKSIVKPLEGIDLDNPENNDTYEELTPLLRKLSKQHRQIVHQMKELKQRSDEFEQITASMSEGLVLLDKRGNVISINTSAKRLFNTDDDIVGNDFLAAYRSVNMAKAIDKALAGRHSEFREEKNDGEYQFMLNPIISDERIMGAVLLCIDVTETAYAERNRQEFTANVSHELKTPLQSIIGSAELLENGLVKEEDKGKFIGNIKTEATRLVSLINDIIRLSQLDEDSESLTTDVNLYDVAREVVEELTPSAMKRNIELDIQGGECMVNGVYRYLYEIIYNLCDNAMRYNKDGGRVDITLGKEDENTVIVVSDTGIGIPVEHQSRIFERFYRVDKSHSKETGGTGLGLSIVKHAVAYHNGSIRLDSREGKGTKIKIIL